MLAQITLATVAILVLQSMAIGFHRISPRYGLAPLLLFMAGLVATLQALGPTPVFFDVLGNELVVADLTTIPMLLMCMLLLYVLNGTAVARVALTGIAGVSVLVLVLQVLRQTHLNLPGGYNKLGLDPSSPFFTRSWTMTFASTIALLIALSLTTVIYQAIQNIWTRAPKWVGAGAALLIAMAIDDVVFRALAFGPREMVASFPGGIPSKTISATLIWPGLAFYLGRSREQTPSPGVGRDRAAFDFLFGSYRQREESLRVTEAEKLRTEAALRETETRFQSTFTNAAIGLIHADLDGRILLANRAFAEFVGRREEDLVGCETTEFTHPDDVEAHLEGMRRLRDGAVGLYEVDERYLTTGEDVVWGHLSVSLVTRDDGGPHYYVIAVEDLTERLATEGQLRQAQKMEAVGQLTGGVAHDFNNLLSVVIGGLEIAIEDGEEGGPQDTEVLEAALTAAHKGAALTRQLLAFSRKQALRPEVIEIRKLLKGMRGLLARTLGERISVQVVIPDEEAYCVADPTQMETALLNLALNARDAMPAGGTLTLAARPVDVLQGEGAADRVTPGRYIEVSVSDTGKGMSPEVMERAFDPFFTTKAVGEGSGLGLSMVYGFVIQSGGAAWLDDEGGAGLTVRLLVPCPPTTDHDASGGRKAPSHVHELGGGETILVVEDEGSVRELVQRMILHLGYEVVAAADANEGLIALRSTPEVALLLTDVVLPGGMNGPELAAEVMKERPELPIVFMSGYAAGTIPDAASLPRDIPMLAKPFLRRELADVLALELNGHSTGRESEAEAAPLRAPLPSDR